MGQCLANGSQRGGGVDCCRETGGRGKSTKERETGVNPGITQRTMSRMLKLDHTSITCVIKGSVMLLSYTVRIHIALFIQYLACSNRPVAATNFAFVTEKQHSKQSCLTPVYCCTPVNACWRVSAAVGLWVEYGGRPLVYIASTAGCPLG